MGNIADSIRMGGRNKSCPAGQIAEAVGRGFAPMASAKIAKQVHADQVALCDDHEMIVSMPRREMPIQTQTRRAA